MNVDFLVSTFDDLPDLTYDVVLCGEVLEHVVDAPAKVLHQRSCFLGFVVKRHLLIEDLPVAGLLHVGRGRGDEPERVVIEVAANVIVPPLRERLVLVVGATILKLSSRNVEDSLASARSVLVHKSQEVLARVPETEPASYS